MTAPSSQPPGPYNLEQDKILDFRAFVRVLGRYKWSILGIVAVATLVAVLIVYAVTPTYRSIASLHIEPKGAQVVNIDEVYEPGYETREYLETQFAILRSKTLSKRVMEREKLFDHPEFQPKAEGEANSIVEELLALLKGLMESDTGEVVPVTEDEKKEAALKRFVEAVKIRPIIGTQLVDVGFDAEDPKLAARVANALAEAYIQSGLDARVDATKSATEWLNQRMPEVKDKLEQSERKLQEFRERNSLVNVGGSRGLVEEDISDNTQRLRDAKKVRTQVANVYRQIEDSNGDARKLQEIPQLLDDPLVQQTKRSFFDARDRVVELQSRYGPKHPQMVSALERETDARSAFERQLRNAADGVKVDFQVADQNVKSLERTVGTATQRIKQLDRKQYELQVLEREVDSNREIYEEFLQRFKETDITTDFEPVNARIVDPAAPSAHPYKPQKKLIVALTVLFSSFLAFLLALARHVLDDSIKSEQELEQATGLGVLGSVPQSKAVKPNSGVPALINDPKSAFAECMRTVRASLMLTGIDNPYKTIVVTSAAPEEGKSTFAINLATALAETEKVLILDCDLRKPVIASSLKLPKDSKGLTEAVAGSAELTECIHPFETGNFDIMPLGGLPPNPVEIITSKKFSALLAQLSERYDRIVIDSAPCLAVSDTLLISKHVDGIVYLVKADGVSRRATVGVLRQLRSADLPLIGAVLNQVPGTSVGRYGAYLYYQGRYA